MRKARNNRKEQARRKALQPRPLNTRPGARGIAGRGGGAMPYLDVQDEFVGSSVQVCGLYPFSSGVGAPQVGVPLGKHQVTRAAVSCDPISWFERGSLISNPSAVILSSPGLGKSTISDVWAVGLAAQGVMPWVFGDVKGEHIDIIQALGGDRVEYGRSAAINVLDSSSERRAAERLMGEARESVRAEGHSRRLSMVEALLTIRRRHAMDHREQSVLSVALTILEEQTRQQGTIPMLVDLLDMINDPPAEVRDAALDRGSDERYRQITDDMHAALNGIVHNRIFAGTFSGKRNKALDPSKPVCFDVSSVKPSEEDLMAACLVATWSTGFGALNQAHALADAGLEPVRRFFLLLDEVWSALRIGHGMVDHYDSLTRLNRQWGVGQAMNIHTFRDLESLPTEHDRAKAKGFMDRAGMVLLGGISRGEIEQLQKVMNLNPRELEALTTWNTPATWNERRGRYSPPPGRGKFLIKSGDSPGIPIDVQAASSLVELHDTNQRWQNRQAAALGAS